MTQEIWKEIKEYQGHTFNGKYEVSSWGNVRKKETQKKMALFLDRGYCRIKLYDNENHRVTLKIHRLVAFTFLPQPADGTEIDHIDGNKQNNSISNLRWVTHQENMRCMYDGIKKARPV